MPQESHVCTYPLMATEVLQPLFANNFAAVFESICKTFATSLACAFCCDALGAGMAKWMLACLFARSFAVGTGRGRGARERGEEEQKNVQTDVVRLSVEGSK